VTGRTIKIAIPLPPDEGGYIGRNCKNCQNYFKTKPLPGSLRESQNLKCPYCGSNDPADNYTTEDQLHYARSKAMRQMIDQARNRLGKRVDKFNRSTGYGHIRHTSTPLPPVRRYEEKELETAVSCEHCGFEYAVYGVYAYCPRCGTRNSVSILLRNCEIVTKELDRSESQKEADRDLYERRLRSCLTDIVSSFDGFGRDITIEAKSRDLLVNDFRSFQNPENAEKFLKETAGFSIQEMFGPEDWSFFKRCFEKRHLFTHKSGIVDALYLTKTNDREAVVGRKVSLTSAEIAKFVGLIAKIATALKESPLLSP